MLLARLVDPFDAFPHADGTEFKAHLRRPHGHRQGATPPDFTVLGKNVNVVAGGRFVEPLSVELR